MMKSFFLGLIALLFPVSLIAGSTPPSAMVAQPQPGLQVRAFLNKPCTTEAGIFITMPPHIRPEYFAAEVTIHGAKTEACWTDMGENIFIIDEAGNQGMLSKGDFKPEDKV